MAAAPAVDAEILSLKELEEKSKRKEVKLTGDDRKAIAQAKATVKELGLDWEALDAAALSNAAPVGATSPVASAPTSPPIHGRGCPSMMMYDSGSLPS
ncbi:MAG: hypothetical protein HC915_20615 [Anaerolineae bacterium]|nr:hypothetical protein [Anaerolineae bacterium]